LSCLCFRGAGGEEVRCGCVGVMALYRCVSGVHALSELANAARR